MTGRRLATIAAVGTLGLGIAGGGAGRLPQGGGHGRGAEVAGGTAASPKSPMRVLAEGIASGDNAALTELCKRVLANEQAPDHAAGRGRGDGPGRRPGRAPRAASSNSHRRPLPRRSPRRPTSSTSSRSSRPRRTGSTPSSRSTTWCSPAWSTSASTSGRSALTEVGRHWNWLPGRAMTPAEERTLAEWKDAFHTPALRCLGDREPKSRAAAVVCLGQLPIDSMAAPAAAYVDDPEIGRRPLQGPDDLRQPARPPERGRRAPAAPRHRARHPRAGRADPQGAGPDQGPDLPRPPDVQPHGRDPGLGDPLAPRADRHRPVVWLLQLSHDGDETVRAKAAEALADRDTPEVDKRLREMASTDASAAVRTQAARGVAKLTSQTTAALPPLPGSPSLNPKAN